MLRFHRNGFGNILLVAQLLLSGWFTTNCWALSAIPMPPMTTTTDHLPLARSAMEYFDQSSDPFHAVQTSIDLLKEAGFEELDEG